MKNAQTIDGAENCTFSVFQATDDEFTVVFPVPGQGIQFAEGLDERAHNTLLAIWGRPVAKSDVIGIHGTLFFQFEKKRHYFPVTNRECDWNPLFLNEAQRRLRGGGS